MESQSNASIPTRSSSGHTLSPVVGWVIFCAVCNLLGWGFSAAHCLTAQSYVIAMIIGGGIIVGWWWRNRPKLEAGFRCSRLCRRFRSGLPMAFGVLFMMAFIGGAIHAPANYDALAYRIPRVLHWLSEGQWHWIETNFPRLNTRTCGFEWLMAPWMALAGTDRLIFLLNTVNYALLPGLCFSVMRRLGVRRRAAARWMWVLPTGYCFLLQAGSVGNDLYGAVCVLAALHFALKAREDGKVRSAALSVLCAALMTGAKTTNVVLLLPWLIAWLPSLRIFARHPGYAFVVVLLAATCSFLPTAALNWKHCGDWTGQRAEQVNFDSGNPALLLANNLVLLTLQNLAPPVFPMANKWNDLAPRLIPDRFRGDLDRAFEPGGAKWVLGELQIEEGAGLGFGLTLLVGFSFCATLQGWRRTGLALRWRRWNQAIFLGAVVAVGVFMAKSGLGTAARLIAPFYLVLLPALLGSPCQTQLVRRRWWRMVAWVNALICAGLLIVSPARPLWPALTLLGNADSGTTHPLLKRARTVYEVYSERADSFEPAREALPEGVKVLGLITFDDPEASLWRPFGQRRVIHVVKHHSGEELRERGVEYILVSRAVFDRYFEQSFGSWLDSIGGRVEKELSLKLRAGTPAQQWVLVKLLGSESRPNDANPTHSD